MKVNHMFTVIQHELPISNRDIIDRLAEVLSKAMLQERIFSYWLPKKTKKYILSKIFTERLSANKKSGWTFYSNDYLSVAVLSIFKYSHFSILNTLMIFGKHIPPNNLLSWWRLLIATLGLNNKISTSPFLYLEAIATKDIARNQGYATRLIQNIEDKAKKMNLPLVCETSDSVMKHILYNRGWKGFPVSSFLIKKLNIHYMLYSSFQ